MNSKLRIPLCWKGSSISATGPSTVSCPLPSTSGKTVSCNVIGGALADGDYTVSYTGTATGIGGASTSGQFHFFLDKTAPAAPTALAVAPSPYLAADKTAGSTVTVTGKAEAGSTANVSLSTSGGAAATPQAVAVNGSGDFTASFANTISDGTLTASVTATDPAGNTGPAASKTATKDTVVPSVVSSDPAAGGSIKPVDTYVANGSEPLGAGSKVTLLQGTDVIPSSSSVSGSKVTTTPTNPLTEGDYTARIELLDAAGNPAAVDTRAFKVDGTNPAAPTIDAPAKINKASAAAYQLTGTGEAGASIAITITGTSGTVTASAQVAVTGTWQRGSIDVSSLPDGVIHVSVTQADDAGNTSPAATADTTKDVVVPRVPTAAFNQPKYGSADATATVSGTIDNGAAAGEQEAYTVSVDDTDAATAPVTVSGTAAVNGTFTSPAIALATLKDGTLTATVVATDGSGNPSAGKTATATRDTGAPATPTVTVTNPVNNANKTAVVVSGKAEAGAAVGITISDTALTSPVTRSATANGSGDYSVSGVDVSSLADGTLTVAVTATDSYGNKSTAGTATTTKDVAAPAAPGLAVPATTSSAQAPAVAVSGTGEVGATITLSATDTASTPAVTKTTTVGGDGSWSTTLDLRTLVDGDVTVAATAKDAAGNTGTSTSKVTKKDTVAPGTPATLVASPSPYVKAQAGSDVTVSGTTASGDNAATNLVVDLTIADTDPLTSDLTQTGVSVTSGSFSYVFTTARIATLTDGTLTLSAVLRDSAGNTSPTKTAALLKDTTAIVDTAHAPSTTFAKAPASASATFNEVLSTGASTIVVKNANNNTIGGSTSFSADGKTITFTPSGAFSESVYTVTVHGVDTNDAGDTKDLTFSFTVDNTPPAAPVVTPNPGAIKGSNQAAYVVSGTGEQGSTVTVTLTGGATLTQTAVVDSGSAWTMTLYATSLSDGSVSVSASQTDLATNVSVASAPLTVTKDTTGSTVTGLAGTATNATTTSTSITGSTEVGASVSLSATDGTSSVGPVAGAVSGTGALTGSLNLATLSDGTITLSATATDSYGNVGSPVTATVTKDTVAPAVSGLAATTVSTATGSTSVTGSTTSGSDAVALSATDGTHAPVTGTATVSGNGSFTGSLDLSALSDGTITVSATPTDAAGNAGSAATTQLTKDATAPSISALNATATTSTTVSSTVTGTRSETSVVVLTLTDGVHTPVTATLPSGTGSFSQPVDIHTLDDGTINVSAKATDGVGNTATATTTTTKDSVGPTVTGLQATATNVATPSTTITGAVGEAATVLLSVGDGSATVTKTISATGSFSTTVDVSSLADGTLTVKAVATDAAGNAGPEASATTTKSTAVPSTPAAPTATAGDRSASVAFTAVAGQTYTATSTPGGLTATGSTSPLTVTGLTNGTSYTFSVTTTNAAGNASTASPASNAVTPRGTSTTALNATPASLRSGTAFALSGKVTRPSSAGAFGSVVLRVKFDNGAVSNLGAVTPAANGTFSKSVRAVYNGTYTATYGGDTATTGSASAGRRTLASAAISASYTAKSAHTSTLVVKGSVAPNKRGAVIYLNQVLANGSTKLLAKQSLSSSSAFSFSLKPAKGSYRLQLVVKATQGNAAGTATFSVTRT